MAATVSPQARAGRRGPAERCGWFKPFRAAPGAGARACTWSPTTSWSKAACATILVLDDYVSNPAIFTLEVLFLVFVTIHAMLWPAGHLPGPGTPAGRRRIVDWGLALVGDRDPRLRYLVGTGHQNV